MRRGSAGAEGHAETPTAPVGRATGRSARSRARAQRTRGSPCGAAQHRSCHRQPPANTRRFSRPFADCTNRSCRMHGRVRGHRPPAVLCSHRTVASLRGRLRLLTVSLTVAFGAAALLAVSHLRVLETSVTEILSRNYRRIEAAEGMVRVVAALRLAVRDGRCPSACAELWTNFERWLAVEHGNYTQPGELELARRIDAEARGLFDAATAV